MLDVAHVRGLGAAELPRLDAFKATYQPPNAPPEQTSSLRPAAVPDHRAVGRQGQADYKPDMNYTVTCLPVPERGR